MPEIREALMKKTKIIEAIQSRYSADNQLSARDVVREDCLNIQAIAIPAMSE